MPYSIYKSNDTLSPFVVINDNTIDTSTVSVPLIGKRKEGYGQPQNQAVLWILENFANSTKPSNAILGQAWFNTVDSKLYVCIDEDAQTFEKVSKPLVGSAFPTLSLTTGDTHYNTTDGKLYIWNGTAWDLVGPQIDVPLSVQEEIYFNRVTSNATPAEMWVDGSTNSRYTIPTNATYQFEARISARRTDAAGEEFVEIKRGVIGRGTSTPSIGNGGVSSEILAKSSGFSPSVAITADTVNNSLKLEATGETSKVIKFNATVKFTKVSNS